MRRLAVDPYMEANVKCNGTLLHCRRDARLWCDSSVSAYKGVTHTNNCQKLMFLVHLYGKLKAFVSHTREVVVKPRISLKISSQVQYSLPAKTTITDSAIVHFIAAIGLCQTDSLALEILFETSGPQNSFGKPSRTQRELEVDVS
eukprot:4768438-Amphidinium_carterae.2